MGLLKHAILKILKKRGESLNIKQIAWELELKGSQYRKKIANNIDKLVQENLIIIQQLKLPRLKLTFID